MAIREPKYSKEDLAARGDELYERKIRSAVEEGNHRRIVCIDVDSGDYEVDDVIWQASERLIQRHPDAQIWIKRIGTRYVHHFGQRHSQREQTMTGVINEFLEAEVKVTVVAAAQQLFIFAVIDTGFDGFLTLPIATIQQLGLTLSGQELSVLADGSECTFDVFVGQVIWHGTAMTIDVHAADATPLVGMALLHGSHLDFTVMEGEPVAITPHSPSAP